MHKRLKFQTSENQNIWIFSDPHFNHNREFLYKPRGFSSTEQQDSFYFESFKVIKPNDNMLMLGDVSLSSTEEATRNFLSCIPCNIYKVWGNHASYTSRIYKAEVLKRYGEDIEVYPLTVDLGANSITFCGDILNCSIDKQNVVASHFPQRIWDKVQHGTYHIHGHSHGNDRFTSPHAKEGKILDCGVENALRYTKGQRPFFSWKEVVDIMDKKNISVYDHHEHE